MEAFSDWLTGNPPLLDCFSSLPPILYLHPMGDLSMPCPSFSSDLSFMEFPYWRLRQLRDRDGVAHDMSRPSALVAALAVFPTPKSRRVSISCRDRLAALPP